MKKKKIDNYWDIDRIIFLIIIDRFDLGENYWKIIDTRNELYNITNSFDCYGSIYYGLFYE